MLADVLSHVIALDVQWLVPFVMDNLLWVFLFACLAHFIYGKGLVIGTVFVAVYLFATFDFAGALGWVFRKGFFWAPILGFLALASYDAFFGRQGLKSFKRPWFASAVFYLGLFFINVILP
ncbi:MAG: hypothetical protein HY544_04850 [Candidatus Diapherotrites archaeon]|uniref:Uncharacterized protein n=1 Tax=Candidatus Iainarchaeum sp. TaxID=3101447 RepID=A0A8T3YM88_9ARCH|nr:hypothetical protein [Candidatus Diapherotrites archaeon]